MNGTGERKRIEKDRRALLLVAAVFVAIVAVGVFTFLRVYDSYIDGVLYRERLSQMREVTTQLFAGLNDVVQSQWEDADTYRAYLENEKPATVPELLSFMQEQSALNRMDEKQECLIAVDELGRYLTRDGWQGMLAEMDLLLDAPAQVSFVSSSMTTEETYMYFLERLSTPVEVWDGEKTVRLLYYGAAQDMRRLNPYFTCEAYDDSNSVFVLDQKGMRLFCSRDGSLLGGYNVYGVLRQLDYLHNNSFDEAKAELDETGFGYANAVLDGEEYYYALYQMDYAAWTLLFLVPSAHVAADVVTMVETTVRMILIFAIVLLTVSAFAILFLMQRKQKQAVEAERRNNAELERMNQELDRKNGALAAAVESAECAERAAREASKAKSEFFSNMSHDIRTPMNAIVGLTSLMEHERSDPEKLESYIRKVQGSSRHLLSLINDVLDMSKIESGGVTLNREPVSLTEQLGQVEGIIRPQAEERGQRFTLRVDGLVHDGLMGDAMRLRQIFINILSNAVKYTPEGGSIDMDVTELPAQEQEQAVIAVTVTDTGCGMTPEFLEHIFEPFTRAESSVTNAVQGTGLGMAITRSIVDMMGGEIRVESEVGKGSCFRLTIPFAIDTGAVCGSGEGDGQPAAADAAPEETALKGMRFLCAEDNQLNAEILEALMALHGASCRIYPNGAELVRAFAAVRPGDYDAILMDVQMPVMNGLEAAQAIRTGENPLGRQIPIIAMTANAFSEDVRACIDAGMDAHVPKPLDMAVLAQALQTCAAINAGGGTLVHRKETKKTDPREHTG